MAGGNTDEPHPLYREAVGAIIGGDLAGLRDLLDRAPELTRARTIPPMGATLLHHTAFNGIEEMCVEAPPATPALARLLIERGAEPDAVLATGNPDTTPLCWALSSWFTAAGGVQTGLCDAYIDGGAKIEGVLDDGGPLGHAIGFGYTKAVEHLAKRGARTDHLLAAAALGDVDRIRGWLMPGGTFTPEALTFRCGEKRETGRFSWPPPRQPDPMSLALVTAATHGRVALVRFLLDKGAAPDSSVSLDQTPLHFSAYFGDAETVTLLLERGALTDIRERQFGGTPADWARETGEDRLAAQIESYGSGRSG